MILIKFVWWRGKKGWILKVPFESLSLTQTEIKPENSFLSKGGEWWFPHRIEKKGKGRAEMIFIQFIWRKNRRGHWELKVPFKELSLDETEIKPFYSSDEKKWWVPCLLGIDFDTIKEAKKAVEDRYSVKDVNYA